MKASRHNGRSGSHGVYNSKHNDREFDLEKAEEIQKELTRNNIYWERIQREAVRHEDRGEDFASFTEVEKGFYDLVYKDYVEGQNARNNAARHSERNRTTDDLRENPKTCPEETIYQIGNIDKHVDYDVLVKVTFDFFNEIQEYVIEKLNANIKDLYDTIDTWEEIGRNLQAENDRLVKENEKLELKLDDVEGLLKEVSDIAYDKACDTLIDDITDKVRETIY